MMKIHINAGHGGKDPGACGNGLQEKDITLRAALKLGNMLKRNFEVSLTRVTDVFVPLAEIARKANGEKADLFISLHCNSAANPDARGIETLVYRNNGENKKVADLIQSKLIKQTGFVNRGVKERTDLLVLNSTNMTAVLIELGFISNREDAVKINQNEFLDSCVEAIYKAVCEYYGVNTEKEDDEKQNIPSWQVEGLKKLVVMGAVEDENYWMNRMNNPVTVGELMGLLGKALK